VTSVPGGRPPLRVAMIGHAFMGAAHSHAWRTLPHVVDLPLDVRMAVLCGRDAARAGAAAARFGWQEAAADWRQVVARDDIDLVDICTPGDGHAPIALAALEAGKHVLCEKPLGNTLDEADAMAAAAASAARRGVLAMVGFTYRRVPALAYAARLVAAGAVGRVYHARAQYLQDWLVDPAFPLTWRLQRERAGSGALGDIAAHAVDLVQYVTGQAIVGVSAVQSTFVPRRPLPDPPSGLPGLSATGSGLSATGAAGGATAEVTVDDTSAFTGRLDEGALVVVEATRFATGRKNALRLEVNGSAGSLAFDLESLNELHVYDATVPATGAGFRRILVTEPEHPYLDAWWPPGHGLGYDHAFVNQARDLVTAIAAGEQPRPSFAEGAQVQRVLDAVERSAAAGSRWTQC
jgi:predicted dehydrogenase